MKRIPEVRARVPLRLGLAGGGTDLSPYCDEFGGCVLNTTIDRFAYAHISTPVDGTVTFRARDLGMEEVLPLSIDYDLSSGLLLHRAVYRHFIKEYCDGVAVPITLSTTIDVPAGSGLGASSALVVALIEAFREGLNLPLGPYDVAKLAFDIERNVLRMQGGRQDQYAAAFGGLNFMEFLPGERVIVNPLRIRNDYLNEFESSLVICFSGVSRSSSDIIEKQVSGLRSMDAQTIDSMHQLKADAIAMKLALLTGDIKAVASILASSWAAKKKTAGGISTSIVDNLHEVAMREGAWAGKVSGAGGGGFLMLLTDPEYRYSLIGALNAAGGQASAAKIIFEGAQTWRIRSGE